MVFGGVVRDVVTVDDVLHLLATGICREYVKDLRSTNTVGPASACFLEI